ncbi:MAG TPA: sugar-binding transcriptional regulator [Thermomicrobiales bacterium]|nr:sugar-binding transcriptional regulator [Thermomicrobiales bacterium]
MDGGRGDTPVRKMRRQHRDGADHRAFLAEVATFYYIDKLTQEQIGARIGGSVATVSRLLAEAHERGIVEVRVHHPAPTEPDLQRALVAGFGLRTARVLRTDELEPPHLLPRLGELAAGYLKATLTDGAIVSVGWGATLHDVARALTPGGPRGVQVVQSMGSLGARLPAIDNHLITRLFAERLHGTPHYLHAPMIVESEAIRAALVQDAHIAQALDLSRRADVMLIGIGVPEPEQAGLLQAGYLDAATLEAIRATGAVGDICVTYFDRAGALLDLEISQRVIGVRLADLHNVGTTIVVAGGVHKAEAILGALRTGLIHVLVTDDATARAVLALRERYPLPADRAPSFAATGEPSAAER